MVFSSVSEWGRGRTSSPISNKAWKRDNQAMELPGVCCCVFHIYFLFWYRPWLKQIRKNVLPLHSVFPFPSKRNFPFRFSFLALCGATENAFAIVGRWICLADDILLIRFRLFSSCLCISHWVGKGFSRKIFWKVYSILNRNFSHLRILLLREIFCENCFSVVKLFVGENDLNGFGWDFLMDYVVGFYDFEMRKTFLRCWERNEKTGNENWILVGKKIALKPLKVKFSSIQSLKNS